MTHMVEFLVKYGYGILFVSILARQACLPVPANLLLVAAGAMAHLGKLNAAAVITFSVTVFLLSDLVWFEAGRKMGTRILHVICKVSAHPGTCEDRIVTRFNRFGVKWLILSKFVIGLDSVAAPMSGITNIPRTTFILYDSLGALIWSSAYMFAGYIFSNQLDRIATYSTQLGTVFAFAGMSVVGVLVVRRLMRWHRFVREFRVGRIAPDDLRDELIAGEQILLLDLQDDRNRTGKLVGIPGAVRIEPRLLSTYRRSYRDSTLPIDRQVVLYCSCQHEFTSARVAFDLQRRGFEHVRPLAGGLQAWLDRGFPVTSSIPTLPPKEHAAYILRDIFQYSRTEAARLLKEKPADLDALLARVRTRIGFSESVNHLQVTNLDSVVPDRRIHEPLIEDAPRRENQLDGD
jgi:membrane protein DedA with SNARE-associated domain/rhodanese-related sulfurtransferase